MEDTRTKDFFIRGVTEESVNTIQDVLDLLSKGELNRHYAETKLNHQSSRSHTVFRVSISSVPREFLEGNNLARMDSENHLSSMNR